MKLSQRSGLVAPFEVMEILARAQAMERAGERVVHLEIGEPDFETPGPAVEEAVKALRSGSTRYTGSMGLAELRGAIATNLRSLCGVDIDPGKEIAVTSGVSGGLFLALAAVLDPGDEVILTDPTYPCYQNFIRFLDGVPRYVPMGEEGFGLDMDQLQAVVRPRTKAILLNSPSNPHGDAPGGEGAQGHYRDRWGAWYLRPGGRDLLWPRLRQAASPLHPGDGV